MKKILLKFSVLLVLAACSDDMVAPQEEALVQAETQNERTASNARTPDGSGSGGSGGYGAGSNGIALTYQSAYGKWTAAFGGTIVWFWGPTPAQIADGIRGVWPVACPGGDNSSTCNYESGFTVYGDGSGFTVIQPMCSSLSTVTITMQRLTVGSDGAITWTPVTRTVTTLSGGNCSLVYSGKVIMGTNCQPIIVDIDSTFPADLCIGVS